MVGNVTKIRVKGQGERSVKRGEGCSGVSYKDPLLLFLLIRRTSGVCTLVLIRI